MYCLLANSYSKHYRSLTHHQWRLHQNQTTDNRGHWYKTGRCQDTALDTSSFSRKYILEGARESEYLRQVFFYKSIAFTILELLAFNAPKFRRSHFENFLKDHVRTVAGNMHVKFEVHSFNHFKLVLNWSDWQVRCAHTTDRNTETHTSNEHIISAIHFVHLAEINIIHQPLT